MGLLFLILLGSVRFAHIRSHIAPTASAASAKYILLSNLRLQIYSGGGHKDKMTLIFDFVIKIPFLLSCSFYELTQMLQNRHEISFICIDEAKLSYPCGNFIFWNTKRKNYAKDAEQKIRRTIPTILTVLTILTQVILYTCCVLDIIPA